MDLSWPGGKMASAGYLLDRFYITFSRPIGTTRFVLARREDGIRRLRRILLYEALAAGRNF